MCRDQVFDSAVDMPIIFIAISGRHRQICSLVTTPSEKSQYKQTLDGKSTTRRLSRELLETLKIKCMLCRFQIRDNDVLFCKDILNFFRRHCLEVVIADDTEDG